MKRLLSAAILFAVLVQTDGRRDKLCSRKRHHPDGCRRHHPNWCRWHHAHRRGRPAKLHYKRDYIDRSGRRSAYGSRFDPSGRDQRDHVHGPERNNAYRRADGITLTGADGITLTGADGITLTGADGTRYSADTVLARRPAGISLTGVGGTTIVDANGITLTGADGLTMAGAGGIVSTGVDGITLTGADSIVGFSPTGVAFNLANPNGISLTGADGITLTGADGITLTGADGITPTGEDGITLTGADEDQLGIQSLDPELAKSHLITRPTTAASTRS